MANDAASKKIYIAYGEGAIGVIDPVTDKRLPTVYKFEGHDSGKVVASVPTAGDMDDMFYDAGRKRIYVAGGEGFLIVVQQVDPDHYTDMGRFATALGTRTGAWYEKRDRLYVGAPPSGILGARLLVFEAQTD